MSIEAFVLVKEKMEVYVNLRIEKHGDHNVNGYDIKVKGRFSNHAILPKLDGELLGAFYTDEKQRELEEFKRKLRFPRIKKAFPSPPPEPEAPPAEAKPEAAPRAKRSRAAAAVE